MWSAVRALTAAAMFALLSLALLAGIASALYELPSAFSGRSIAANTYKDISAAISLLELDDFLEVVLVGNFTTADVAALSAVLEDAAEHAAIKPLRSHIYEKKIYRVSLSSRVLSEKVSKAIQDDTPGVVSATLVGYHARLGGSTTLFVIAADQRREWTQPKAAADCITILNMRAPGAAWVFLDDASMGAEYSMRSMQQFFDGFPDVHVYEWANVVNSASDMLMPFPSAAITPPSAAKDFIFLEISFCDAYTREAGCPEDSVVRDTLRGMDEWLERNNQVSMKVQSVSFNINDHPELVYALHAASHYSDHERDDTVLNLEVFVQHASKLQAFRRAVSSAADDEGHNKEHSKYTVIPIINLQLSGHLRYVPRGGRKIQSFPLPRWRESDPTLDYPSAKNADITAIVRVKADKDPIEDLFTYGSSVPCGEGRVVPRAYIGDMLFDALVWTAWGVLIPPLEGVVQATTDGGGDKSVMLAESEFRHDFRRGRSVDRNVLISKFENVMSLLNQLVLAYSELPAPLLPTTNSVSRNDSFNPSPIIYDDVFELLNSDTRGSDGVQVFLNAVALIELATVEFSHLNYDTVHRHLHFVDLLVNKLRDIMEQSSKRVTQRKVLRLYWGNDVDLEYSKAGLDSPASSFSPSPKAILLGSLAGILIFFLLKVGAMFGAKSSPGGLRNDPFRRHAGRSLQKRN